MIGRVGAAHADQVAAHLDERYEPTWWVRQAAVEMLGSIGAARTHPEALAERLFDGNYFVRKSAERLLPELGRAGAEVVAARLGGNYPWFIRESRWKVVGASERALVLLPRMGEAGAVHALVERFDIEPFSDFSAK